MKAKMLTLVVVLCVGLGILVVEGFSATAGKKPKQKPISLLAPSSETDVAAPKAIDVYRSLSGKFVGCEDIDPERGVIIEHVSVGNTWRDEQQIGSMGRTIAVAPQNGFRHFTWSYMDGPDEDHYVYANCLDPWTPFETGPTPVDGGSDRSSAYAHVQLMDYDPATLARAEIPGMTYDRYEGDPPWYTALSIDYDECGGYWFLHWDVPDWVYGYPEGGRWPRCKVVHVPFDENTGKDYFHIVPTDVTTPYYILGWVRCYLDQTIPYPNLISETYHNGQYKTYTTPEGEPSPGPLYEPIAVVDTASFVDAVVEASPVSKRVAIVYTRAVASLHADETWGCDVVFVEDMSNGDGWLAGTNPLPAFYNCTNYPAEGDDYIERAFINLSACYDYEDSLHIAYVTTMIRVGNGGYHYAYPAWLYHWSKKTGNRLITRNCPDDFEPPGKINMYPYWWWGTIAGEHNAAISKPSIAALDPIYHPGEDVYLYCIWTQFDSADVSRRGRGNGDIFGAASSDGGYGWEKGWNLTNTQTDECSTGKCVSEHWASLAQNMYNGDLHIQYICDRDAGSAVGGQSAWTDNDVYYLDLEEWEIIAYPILNYRIKEPENPPNWTKPPLKVPEEDRDVFLMIYNIGNAPLVYSVTDNQPVCIVTPGAMPTLAAGDSQLVPITLEGESGCENTFVDGMVTITTDDPDHPITYLPIQAVVDVEAYYECPRTPETEDTVDNTAGNTQSGLIFYTNANCEEWFHYYDPVYDTTHEVGFQGGIIVATIRDGDTLVGRCMGDNDHKADVQDSLYVEQHDVDWEPDFWTMCARDIIINDLDPPKNDKWFCWEISKIVKFFKPTAPPEYRNLVIKYVRVKRQAPPGWWPGGTTDCTDYGNTYIGIAMDLDCPWDSMGSQNGRNFAGYDDVNEIAYQQGWEVTGEHPDWNDFYCGIALAEETADTTAYQAIAPFGTYNVRNDEYLYPQSGWGWKDGELYQLAENNVPGVVQDEDTTYGLDRTQVFTALEIPAGSDPDAEYDFILVEAVAPGGLAELQSAIDLGRLVVAREKAHQFPAICGDALRDGVVELGDILYLIAYAYRGGPPPVPFNTGDVDNCNGIIDLGDILWLIAYAYKGGPPPNCCMCPGCVW